MKVEQIGNFLLEKFPLEKQAPWDNSGWNLLFDEQVNKILITLDLTRDIIKKCIKMKVNLIIVHHPFYFFSSKKDEYLKAPYKKSVTSLARKNKISILALHTNYDFSNQATAYSIIKQLNLDTSNAEILDPANLLIKLDLDFNSMVQIIKKAIKIKHLQSNVTKNYKLKKVAILPGSGGIEAVLNAKKHKADLVITSDLKWSDQLAIDQHKIKVLQVSHLIEQCFIYNISDILKENFAKIEIHTILQKEILENI
ncbi:Nif3-like dinuclear metal center hexameric protein [Mesomycoplasma conjunctivae]|uniref:Nif3-like dinuclear metal center hexameric protein n=1 Tax=Mesomycoplasma conjunctivae TaxID=45361 RepID=UPI003DA5C21A